MNKTQKPKFGKSFILNKITIQKSEIPELERSADYAGSCWESEKLGFARGYIQALEEVLANVALKDDTGWVKAGRNEYGPPIN